MAQETSEERVALPVVDSVTELIGDTPMVRLRRVVAAGGAAVWAKCEHLLPGGSLKDRICLAMIEAAEREGELSAGQVVVEPTSGNTGIGLAIVCAVKRHPLVLTMPASMSLERRQLLRAFGAEVVLTEPEATMEGARDAAERIALERSAFMPRQFDNPHNPHAHETTTAEEIVDAMAGERLDVLVAAVGTGGSITGLARALRRAYPELRVIAVEPQSSAVLSGAAPGPSKIQGIGAGFVPANFDRSVVDEIRVISDADAWAMKARLAREEGLLVGVSAGANVAIAVQVAAELSPAANVITLLCDTGERYFSLGSHFEESGK